MNKSIIELFLVFSLLQGNVQEASSNQECSNYPSNGHELRISLNGRKNESGKWIDELTAWAESSNSSDTMNVDLIRRVFERDGKRVFYVKGVTETIIQENYDGKLLFHAKTGKNIAIIDGGRTVQKIDINDPHNSVVFTNRALRDDEIFEIKLEKKNTKFGYSLGIGVTSDSPDVITILPQMHVSKTAWMYHHDHIYNNNAVTMKSYGKNLNELKVGDRIGVMRSRFGALHFFYNGVDQGPAASNMPDPVYGVLELWNDATKATLV